MGNRFEDLGAEPLAEFMGDEIKKMGNLSKTEIYRGMDGFFRSQGLRIPNY
jgi:hypothetical protein